MTIMIIHSTPPFLMTIMINDYQSFQLLSGSVVFERSIAGLSAKQFKFECSL